MTDRIAFVTGAARGIGLAVAEALGARGWTVWLGIYDPATGAAAASKVEAAGGTAHVLPLDVTLDASVAAAAAAIDAGSGRLDVLVNNVGTLEHGSALALPASSALRSFDVNALGPWRVTAACAPLLRKGRSPRVANVSSGAGSISEMEQVVADHWTVDAYRVAKAGLNALTRLHAFELAADGILVNAACPGWVRTEMGGPHARRSPEEGAASILALVDLPDGGPTGGFFRDGEPIAW